MSVESEATGDEHVEGLENTTVLGVEGQSETGTSETSENENVETKSFTQDEVERIVQDRLARDRRTQQRAQEARTREQELRSIPVTNIDPNDYATTEDYAEALADAKLEQALAARETARRETEFASGYEDRETETRAKYADFQQVAYNADLKITQPMASAIMAAEAGPEVLYHLGKNPDEATRISKLDPTRQAVEIGKLEAKVASAPAQTKTTSAPPPINPVSTRTQGGKVLDTTDPRAAKELTMDEWAAAEDARLKRKAKGL